MIPASLNCPMCGAAVSTDAPQCLYCRARLATVACPSCFGMMFLNSRHCPHCGAKGARAEDNAAGTEKRSCPRCRVELESVHVGETVLRECARCAGLWVDVASFQKICADREQQAAALGTATFSPTAAGASEGEKRVRYVPCPECKQLMNRVNFARCSGVVVDVCKGHGTWFDRDELRQIIEFIRDGGMDAARSKEKQRLADEWRQLRQEQQQLAARNGSEAMPFFITGDKGEQTSVIVAARELLKLILE